MEKECNRAHEAKHLVKLAIAVAVPLAGFIISNLTAPRRKPAKRTTSSPTSCQEEEEDMMSSPTCTSHCVFSDDEERPHAPDSASLHCEEQGRTETPRSLQMISAAGFTEALRVQRSPEDSDEVSVIQHQEGPGLGEEVEGLKRAVTCVEDGQRELESQFRQYVIAREQESWYQKLQIMNMGLKLESLETQNQKTDEAAAANYRTVTVKLGETRAELRLLGKKVKRLCKSSRLHSAAIRGHDLALHHGETELRRANEELMQAKEEIRFLRDQLQGDRRAAGGLLQVQTASHASTSKGEEEAMKRLREREFMAQQLLSFQHRWYAEMEELIYLGWVGACMRHEMLMTSREDEEEEEEEEDHDHDHDHDAKLIPVQEAKDQLIMELPAAHCKAKECRVELHGSGGSSPVAELAVADQMDVVASSQHTAAAPKKPRLLLRKIKGWARSKGKDKAAPSYTKD